MRDIVLLIKIVYHVGMWILSLQVTMILGRRGWVPSYRNEWSFWLVDCRGYLFSISAKELSLIPLATSICDKDWRLKRIVLHFVLHQISIAILQPTCIDLQQALGIGSAVFLSVEFSQKNFDDFFFFFFYQAISLAPLFYQIIYSFSAVSEFSHIFTGYSSIGCDQDHTVYFFCCLFIYYISVLWILLPVNRL